MHPIAALFGKSPFGPLVEHAKKVHECVLLVRPITDAWLAEEYDKINLLRKQLSKTEHEADIIKAEIREHLPKSIFLPVNRMDLLNYLKAQDSIADSAKDYAVLLTYRQTRLPEALHGGVREYVEKVIATSQNLCELAQQISELMRKALQGPEIRQALEITEKISTQEWESDKIERRLLQDMFAMEREIDPVSIFMLMKIFDSLGRLANSAENTADLLRMMILTR